jgi:N-acyl-D-aspartate/D-glutamate deacylase
LNSLLASGVTTVIGRADPNCHDALETPAAPFELPVNWGFVTADEMNKTPPVSSTFAEIADAAWQDCKRFGLATTRGKIRRDYFADLVLYDAGSGDGAAGPVRQVIVAGETVWADGKPTGNNAGSYLRCGKENRLC